MIINHNKNSTEESRLFSITGDSELFTIDIYDITKDIEPTEETRDKPDEEKLYNRVKKETPWGPAPYELTRTFVFDRAKLESLGFIVDRSVLLPSYTEKDNSITRWINLTKETSTTKISGQQFFREYYAQDADSRADKYFYLCVPFKNSSDIFLYFMANNQNYPILLNGAPVSQELPKLNNSVDDVLKNNYFCTIEASAPASVQPSQEVIVNLQLKTYNGQNVYESCELYAETTAGYLPKQRINIVNGTAQFTLLTQGLSSGDVIRVKLGWRYWTGETEFTINVI
jgi:hypothetical protein